MGSGHRYEKRRSSREEPRGSAREGARRPSRARRRASRGPRSKRAARASERRRRRRRRQHGECAANCGDVSRLTPGKECVLHTWVRCCHVDVGTASDRWPPWENQIFFPANWRGSFGPCAFRPAIFFPRLADREAPPEASRERIQGPRRPPGVFLDPLFRDRSSTIATIRQLPRIGGFSGPSAVALFKFFPRKSPNGFTAVNNDVRHDRRLRGPRARAAGVERPSERATHEALERCARDSHENSPLRRRARHERLHRSRQFRRRRRRGVRAGPSPRGRRGRRTPCASTPAPRWATA